MPYTPEEAFKIVQRYDDTVIIETSGDVTLEEALEKKCAFLDDERKEPEGFERHYWPEETIAFLEENEGEVGVISLDNDLQGETPEQEGVEVMRQLKDKVVHRGFTPPDVLVFHTKNSEQKPEMIRLARTVIKYHDLNQRGENPHLISKEETEVSKEELYTSLFSEPDPER
ncbi:MAG: cyclic-phosphate processing receiver domain-containing protein [Pseudomonadota bacterium]|nr:cyclic-phosphate processing receiver domain-containing protein [Pseudomonadota bacterium]